MPSLSPGGALGGPGRRSGPPENKTSSLNLYKPHPGPHNLSDRVKDLARSLCRVSARGVAWVGLERPVRRVA